ncbi:MAG: imidazolonepropionase [Flavobacteriales bacterium]|jgi:imidazolonepropionase
MKLLVKNIGALVGTHAADVNALRGSQLAHLPMIQNAWLAVEDEVIVDFGEMADWPGISDWRDLEIVDADGGWIIPGYCDSHSHAVFAASRAGEFSDRIKGMTYEEIAAKGGGILNSAAKLADMSEDALFEDALDRLDELMRMGTTSLEIKSGYGLSTDAELKMLRVIKRLKQAHPMNIKATFLGAHAYPADYKNRKEEYVKLIVEEMLPRVAEQGLAEFIDVFCEENYFSVTDTERILGAAKALGLIPKVHVNQFNAIGGVEVCVRHGALSVDHLEVLTDDDVTALRGTNTAAVALPGCSLFIKIPYTPARKLIDNDIIFALASDFNPGSSPSGNMNLVMSLACVNMNITPEEALNASTLNGAYAMGLNARVGSITLGKQADFLIVRPLKEIAELPYYFGSNLIQEVYIKGERKI